MPGRGVRHGATAVERWGLAIGLAGSAGTVPLAYLLFGRRRG